MHTQMSQIRRSSSVSSNKIARGLRAVIEAVESRRLMSIVPGLPEVNIGGVNLTQTGTTVVTSTTAKATQALITAVPSSLSAGGNGVVVVHLADATGTVDASQNGTVTLSINSGPTGATLGGTVTATASHGVATFTGVVVTKAGDYTFKATADGLTAGTSSVVEVVPGAASQLSVVSQPVLALLGKVVQPIVVAVEDVYGNVVTTADSVVTLAAQTGTAATTTATPTAMELPTTTAKAVNGIATFSDLTITTAGTGVLTATATALAAAKSAPLTVTIARATPTATPTPTPTVTPVVAPIANLVAGAKSPSVSIDVSAALPAVAAATKVAAVSLSIQASDGSVVMTGSARVKSGLATLPSLKLHVAGTYTVTLTDSGGATVSRTIVVQPSAPATLVFTQLPGMLNDKATVAVQAIDKWGNATTLADGSAVTLSLGKGGTFGKFAALTGATTATLKGGIATFTGGLAVSGAVNPGGYAKLTASLGKLSASTDATYTVA